MSRQLSALLHSLEEEMKSAQLWQFDGVLPPVGVEPFSIDTMNFPQWLQAVFIPRFNELISTKRTLPQKLALSPMAEVYFLQTTKTAFETKKITPVLLIIRQIDAAFEYAAQGHEGGGSQ